mmetsp:Transcript_59402/g.125873  ORF Transcript_59402/g.125873 Transcript_59402/m.125873 type:complete len:136 (-) Transcript_59402:117-524(-)
MNVVEDKGQELVQLVSRIGVRAPLRSWDALQRSNSMRTAEPNSHKEESSEDNSRRGFQLQPVADPPAAADTLETLRFWTARVAIHRCDLEHVGRGCITQRHRRHSRVSGRIIKISKDISHGELLPSHMWLSIRRP